MRISGIQKLTLLDYPGLVACTVFCPGCNFRCPFCQNSSLVLPELIDQSSIEGDVLDFLSKRQGLLDGVAVTGGEPLLQTELPDFLIKLRDLGYKIKLDTNGSLPERLESVINAGLVDRVAMDIKSSPDGYSKAVGIPNFKLDAVRRSRDILLEGCVEYEFRTTLVKGLHTVDTVREAANWIAGAKEYYLQQFRDSGAILDIRGLSAFDENEMNTLLSVAAEYVPAVKLRGV